MWRAANHTGLGPSWVLWSNTSSSTDCYCSFKPDPLETANGNADSLSLVELKSIRREIKTASGQFFWSSACGVKSPCVPPCLTHAAALEAEDIELHLRPLKRQISYLEECSFTGVEPFIGPLFHTLCLIWSRCHHYCIPARIVVLLREFCNLLIEKVRVWRPALGDPWWRLSVNLLRVFELQTFLATWSINVVSLPN